MSAVVGAPSGYTWLIDPYTAFGAAGGAFGSTAAMGVYGESAATYGGLFRGTSGNAGGAQCTGIGSGSGVIGQGGSSGGAGGVFTGGTGGYGIQAIGASGTPPINIAGQSAAPTAKNPGDMYYNTTTNIMYYWNGSSWIAM
jgi:hypothetical protein